MKGGRLEHWKRWADWEVGRCRYEYRDADDSMIWKRCYGIEHWTFDAEGKMEKRMMSGNDVDIGEEGRWLRDGVDVDAVTLGEKDF